VKVRVAADIRREGALKKGETLTGGPRSERERVRRKLMIAIISLLLVVVLSILVTRVATVALTHTGLSKEAARFQARSAFSGVGFTTSESEKVVSHPVRRRILMLLMLLGNAGIVTAMTSLILGFISAQSAGSITLRIVILLSGLVLLWTVASSQWLDQRLSKIISRALKSYTRLDVQDYASLLHLAGEYEVTELQVEPEDWLANETLQDLKLRDEGVLVLGITREDDSYIGAPKGPTKILPGDILILYGRSTALESLDQRRSGWRGDREHEVAVLEQKEIIEKEECEEESSEES
jgi:hypothetical protein